MHSKAEKTQGKKTKTFIYYLFALYIIYSTDSLIVGLELIPILHDLSYLFIIFLGIALFGIMFVKRKGTLRGPAVRGFVLSITVVLLSAIVNLDVSPFFLIKIGCLVIGFYIANEIDTKLFIKAYIHIMVFISIFSILVYFFTDQFLDIGSKIFPEILGYKEQTFKVFWLTNVRTSLIGFRNWGPFWEPGVYQTYLILAIVFLLFHDVDIRRKNIAFVVLIITLATTFSTTGFIASPFILLAYILHKPQKKRVIFVKIMFLFALVAFVAWFVNSEFFIKVFESKFENLDQTGRNITVEYGLKLWKKNPIFGCSSNYGNELFEVSGFRFSITNTFVGHLIAFGTFMGVYSLYAIIAYSNSLKAKKIVRLLIAVGIILSCCGENYIYSPIISFLMFYRNQDEKCVDGLEKK